MIYTTRFDSHIVDFYYPRGSFAHAKYNLMCAEMSLNEAINATVPFKDRIIKFATKLSICMAALKIPKGSG